MPRRTGTDVESLDRYDGELLGAVMRHFEEQRTRLLSELPAVSAIATAAIEGANLQFSDRLVREAGHDPDTLTLRTRLFLGLIAGPVSPKADMNVFVEPDLRGLKMYNEQHNVVFTPWNASLQGDLDTTVMPQLIDVGAEIERSETYFLPKLEVIRQVRTSVTDAAMSDDLVRDVVQSLVGNDPKAFRRFFTPKAVAGIPDDDTVPLVELHSGKELNSTCGFNIRALLKKLGARASRLRNAAHILFHVDGFYLISESRDIEFVPASAEYRQFFGTGQRESAHSIRSMIIDSGGHSHGPRGAFNNLNTEFKRAAETGSRRVLSAHSEATRFERYASRSECPVDIAPVQAHQLHRTVPDRASQEALVDLLEGLSFFFEKFRMRFVTVPASGSPPNPRIALMREFQEIMDHSVQAGPGSTGELIGEILSEKKGPHMPLTPFIVTQLGSEYAQAAQRIICAYCADAAFATLPELTPSALQEYEALFNPQTFRKVKTAIAAAGMGLSEAMVQQRALRTLFMQPAVAYLFNQIHPETEPFRNSPMIRLFEKYLGKAQLRIPSSGSSVGVIDVLPPEETE